MNVVPPAVFLLGAGALVFGVRPRAVPGVTYGVLVWSFLVELLGGLIGASHWLLDTSLFHQMAAAPSVTPDWTTDAVMVALGVLAAALGILAFERRDLTAL